MSTVNAGWRGPNIVKEGLVLYLDAASGTSYSPYTSGTTWRDISGNGNNGTLTNGPTYSSANGGSFVFDGVDDYAQITPIQPTFFTLSVWFKATGIPSSNDLYGGYLIGSNPQLFNNAVQYSLSYSWTSQRITFGVQSNTTPISTADNTVLRNTDYSVITVYNGQQRLIYINSLLIASDNYTTNPIYPTTGNLNTQIGRWGFGEYGRYFNGNIYTAQIYNRALSAQEVLQNYNAQKSRFGL